MNIYIGVLWAIVCLWGQAHAQVQITGKVIDGETQAAMLGASIRVIAGNGQTITGALADTSGAFNLNPIALDSDYDKLICSYVFYRNDTISLAGMTGEVNFLITLLKDTIWVEPYFDPNAKFQPLSSSSIIPVFSLQRRDISSAVTQPSFSISTISKRDFSRNDPVNIQPYLNRVPGVFMQSGALNTNRITIRGIGARSPFSTTKIRAYLADIPLTGGDGETTLEDIDLGFIRRAEIMRGPSSSVYGAGLGGTIRLQLADRSDTYRSNSLQAMYGSFGTYRALASLRASSQNGMASHWLSASQQHSDGYRANNQYDRTSVSFATSILAGKDNQDGLTLIGSFIRLNAEIPSSLDSLDFVTEPTKAAFTWANTNGREASNRGLLGISYRKSLSPKQSLVSSIFGNFRYADEVRPFNLLRESSQTAGVRARYLVEGSVLDKYAEATIGFEGFQEWYNWQTYANQNGQGQRGGILSDNAEQRQFINLFAQGLWKPVEPLEMIVGANVNLTRYRYQDYFLGDSLDQSGDYSFEPVLSPRLGLRYSLKPTQTVFLQIAHGFSPPSVSETLNPDGTLNPDVQPETGWNYELGWYGFPSYKARWQVSAFYMDVRNLLVPRRTDFDTFVGVNAGRTSHMGVEAEGRLALLYTRDHRLIAWGSYTWAYYRFEDFFDEEQDVRVDGRFIPGIPRHHLNVGLDWTWNLRYWEVITYVNGAYVTETPIDNANTVFNEDYVLLNAKVEVDIKGYVKAYFGVNNLSDTRYASMLQVNAQGFGGRAPRYFYPGLARNFYGGLTFSW